MSLAEATLPFTTTCTGHGNFPGEYKKALRWRCNRYEGHPGTCRPDDLDKRMYQRRNDRREAFGIPEDAHLSGDTLRHVVDIAVEYGNYDQGIMWHNIIEFVAFANFVRLFSVTG